MAKRKAKRNTKLIKKSHSLKIKDAFTRFKSTIEFKLGKINWKKISTATFALLMVVALTGVLGPQARFLARTIVKYTI